MCRLMAVRAHAPVDVVPLLRAFAERCRSSREYQGDGWGAAWWDGAAWGVLRTVAPIWASLPDTLPRARTWIVHARSAFRSEGVRVDNNMPFVDGALAFAFNGELRGVRLQVPGETGAWKLFHLVRRFAGMEGGPEAGPRPVDLGAVLERLDAVVAARTAYVRALNVMASDGERVWLHARFGEDPDYFTLWRADVEGAEGPLALASSEPLDVGGGTEAAWRAVTSGTTLEMTAPCSS